MIQTPVKKILDKITPNQFYVTLFRTCQTYISALWPGNQCKPLPKVQILIPESFRVSWKIMFFCEKMAGDHPKNVKKINKKSRKTKKLRLEMLMNFYGAVWERS